MGKKKRRSPHKKTQNRWADQWVQTHRLKQEVRQKVYEEKAKELDDITSIYFMSYIALALHRELGFGQTRIARILKAMDDLDTEMCGKSLEEIKAIVYDECKILFGKDGGDQNE